MFYNERQDSILRLLKAQKNIKVGELAKKLYVSESTIRRDLAEMQKIGVIERSRGGAVFVEVSDETSLYVRMNENAKRKELAATNAIGHIPEFRSVFIDSSTTALALARRLPLEYKTVVTNNLQTAMTLSGKENVNLIILGGSISTAGVSVTGSWTAKQLAGFRFDLMLTSCAAICGGKAYEKSLEQREIKLAAFENSERKILIADGTKLSNNAGTYLYRDLAAFDLIVFDRLTPEEKESLKGLPVIC